ncbi:unnamed protein product [marine sediment metagenome]|uniref:Uncharacterized protein n=1 Tax=marine sediment metagenome TaxID=412755 RepID=X0W2A2_9ZZZZ
MKLPLGGMLKLGIGYLSNLVNSVAPDELDEGTRKTVQKAVATIYTAAKNWGPDLVAASENDLDDQVLKEAVEICESVARKYGLELNPIILTL